MAAGAARLAIGGEEIELDAPRLVRKRDVLPLLPPAAKTLAGVSDGADLLRMDVRRRA